MSSDNGIRLRQLPDGKWVGYMYFDSAEESGYEMPLTLLTDSLRYRRYDSLEDITQAYREIGRDTEYGFDIVHYQPPLIPDDEVLDASFKQELTDLINRYSKENASGTPDYILADYLMQQLGVWDKSVAARADWRGESVDLPGLRTYQEAKTFTSTAWLGNRVALKGDRSEKAESEPDDSPRLTAMIEEVLKITDDMRSGGWHSGKTVSEMGQKIYDILTGSTNGDEFDG